MQIVTSVRNDSDAWEVIAREAHQGEDITAPVYADDLGGEPGQDVRIEIRDEDDVVVQARETVAV